MPDYARVLFRMAQEHGMIEPYVERQVRGADDSRVISYGVSSYGYDVRCSNEFKIFTNVHSATVDPKNFDDNSFVNYTGDVCIIPPNSFALARTVVLVGPLVGAMLYEPIETAFFALGLQDMRLMLPALIVALGLLLQLHGL